MNFIPPFDLTRQYQIIGDELNSTVLEVLASGKYINGPIVQTFEDEFASYIGAAHCIGCNSGTDALYLALRALDIGPGDEVITTPFSFFATAETISAVGAMPVFVDIETDSLNIDPTAIESAITADTKAIMPVHLFGRPADMTRIMAIAQAHNLPVIEDCAQATGACWNNQKVGSIGLIGCFSFFPTKNLGASGDGGALTTSDPAIADRIRVLKEHGSRTRYYHEAIGVNSRLDAMQAAVLRVKLRYLEQFNWQREAIAHRYSDLLSHLPGIVIPGVTMGGRSVWNQYTIRVLSDGKEGNRRDRLRQQLQDQGIASMIYYPVPLHQQSVYAHLNDAPGQLPVTDQVSQEVLSLPMFPELTAEEQKHIYYVLKESLVE